MYPKNVPHWLADCLYREAERLARRYANIPGAEMLVSECVEQTLNLLQRTRPLSLVRRPEAARALRAVFSRQASRAWWRHRKRVEAGRQPAVSLDAAEVLAIAAPDNLDRLQDARRLVDELAPAVMAVGARREVAEALLWHAAAGLEWEEVRCMLRRRLGVDVPEATLRKWWQRYSGRMKAVVAEAYTVRGATGKRMPEAGRRR